MRERISEWKHLLPDGTGDVVVLAVQVLVVLILVGWAYNRGFRQAERGPLVRLPLLVLALGVALLVRHIQSELWQPIVIAGSVIIAGLFNRTGDGRGMGIPMVMIAALFGLGYMLSAITLTVVTVLVYMLSPVKKR
ncbi:MAG: hypothetical protein J5I62_10930 [Flavobacteriales bacterium]|nr:hypothetical protein [Flavobacteriales bacterium]MEB2343017.1 hypothetical protein [Flavobacteriia bacterium]